MKPRPLLLVPTEGELALLHRGIEVHQSLAGDVEAAVPEIHLCGFGPVVAAARAAHLIATLQPNHVILLGVAGRFSSAPLSADWKVGMAVDFDTVDLDGLGVGSGDTFESAITMGFSQWPDPSGEKTIDGQLLLSRLPGGGAIGNAPHALLTVFAASADSQHAAQRLARFPAASAEDMESFGVAAACRLAGVSCSVVRGLSNEVGVRDKKQWQIKAAMEAVAGRLLSALPYLNTD